jgi:hypothetical protein
MNAPPKLIQKYVTEYNTRFPNYTLVLVECSVNDMFITSTKTYETLLQPAIDIIQACLSTGSNDRGKASSRGTLVGAVYSNGGSHALTSLARIYRSLTSSPLPIDGLVLDSCPGDPNDLSAGHRAISASLPPSIRIWLSIPLWTTLYTFYIAVQYLGFTNPIARLYDGLVDTSLFKVGGKRTYIYSYQDEIVSGKAVEDSAKRSGEKGWNTRLERFEESRHVAHAVLDRERYWGAVMDTVGDS